jgi:hypothetical protein
MGLVEYGSDSGSEDEITPSVAIVSSKPLINLPPPSASASSSSMKLPPPKRSKGPVRIMLDLPTASSEDHPLIKSTNNNSNEPPKKRVKLALGSSSSSSLGGLMSMLPAPKNKSSTPTTEKVLGGNGSRSNLSTASTENDESEATERVVGFMPYSLSKGKGKKVAEVTAPAIDFFGLSSLSSPFLPAPSLLASLTITHAIRQLDSFH